MKLIVQNGKFLLASATKALVNGDAAVVGNSPTTLTLAQFYQLNSAKVIIQRKPGLTTADIPVPFTYTGLDPTNLQARIVNASSGAVVLDWTNIPLSLDTANKKGVGTLAGVPQGDASGNGYYVQLRDGWLPNNSLTISNGTTKFGVGVRIPLGGQSNMVGTMSGGYGADASNQLNLANIFDNVGFHGLGNTTNAASSAAIVNGTTTGFMNTATNNLARLQIAVEAGLQALYGIHVPVCIIPWAYNSTGIDAFNKPVSGSNHWTELFEGNGAAGYANIGLASDVSITGGGDFELMYWYQGEADSGTYSSTIYKGKLDSLVNNILTYLSAFGRTASTFHFGAVVLGNYDVTGAPYAEDIRKAVLDFEADNIAAGKPNLKVSHTCVDISRNGNQLHLSTEATQQRSMARFIQTALKDLGCASFSGHGPKITTTSVAHSGSTAILTVAHEGGTALTTASGSTTPTGFYANSAADFTGADIAVTASITAANQITLTFGGSPAFPLYVKYMGGKVGSTVVDGSGFTASCNPDITNPVYDNVTYPTAGPIAYKEALGLPLLPTVTAIAIS